MIGRLSVQELADTYDLPLTLRVREIDVSHLLNILIGSVSVRVTNAVVDAILANTNMEDNAVSSEIVSMHSETVKSKLDLVSSIKSDDTE
eukprot:10880128-Ditylum_brightwellii.AAC.1